MSVSGKNIIVGISGGIAAMKSPLVVRELMRRGANVRVVLSAAATRFVGAITFAGITGKPPVVDLWDPTYAGEVHVELGAWADAMVVVPATMNVLAKVANGFADDALTATLACQRGPVLFAPGMHPSMWTKPATQRNVAKLRADGAHVVGPVVGPLASGESGMGRLEEPNAIVDALEALLVARDLEGVRVLVTAGPTNEDLDPVRFLGNRSTGKMGFAIAERAAARGAKVTLVRGPVALDTPAGVDAVSVRSALEMHAAVFDRKDAMDVVIMTAAVADYRPKTFATEKIKKGEDVSIELVRNPDILLELGAARSGKRPILVGFALETTNIEAYARDKLTRKKADLIVANEAKVGFGGDDNDALLVSAEGTDPTGPMSKRALADRILDRVRSLISA
jgi:phosphopantothenoylcysteine decarboxylase/phosphopantothenate--cysteine ligase